MSATSMCRIQCRCGHSGDMEEFTRTPDGYRKPNQFRCPSCCTTWEVRPIGAARMTEDGFVIPQERKIVVIEAGA
ncbi:MAG TPA: hypothetical protein PK600_04630 [Deltaproteobacteria bacterium]|nr:hypothetical protein [Deltaproteobacteria bacterium]